MAIYFNQPYEAYEFLIKSDNDLKSSLCHVLDDYKRKKDETRMELNKGSLLDKIRYYADAKKRRNLAFLEEYDNRITREMLIKWLEMSKFMENVRQKMVQEPEKPLEKSVDLQEEIDPFEEQKRQIEQRMREKEEEERRLQEEDDFRMKMMMIQQYVRSIQKNQAFLDCNRFHLNRLVRNWREKALAIHHQKLQDQKAKLRTDSKSSIFIKVLEITQSVLPNPSLSLADDNNRGSSHELKVVGQVKAVRLFAAKAPQIKKDVPKDGNKEAQKEEKIEDQAAQILWQTMNEALFEAKANTPKNAVTFTLSDSSHSSVEYQARVQLSEFLRESTNPLKVYYLALHPERDGQKHGILEPLIKFKVFIGDRCPRESEWDLDLVKDLQKGNIKDPVYDEIIRLPKYTPKNIGFLIEILRTWGLFDIEMNYRRLIEDFKFKKPENESSYVVEQAQPVNKKLLQEVIETLFDFTIDETSKSHARSQGNLRAFFELERKMSEFLNGELNKVKEHHYYDPDEDDDNLGEKMNDNEKENLLRLKVKVAEMRFRANEGKAQVNNGKSEKETATTLKLQGEDLKCFEKICLKGGIPNEKRPFLWSFLGNVEEIKIKAVEFANGSDHVMSYERGTKPTTEKLNPNNSLSFIYTRLLTMADSSDECQLVRQMIADDIALLNESEDFSNEEEQKLMNKILLAFAFLMEKLKSSDPMRLNPYKHIFYSMPIMKITRKIIAITNSKFLDQENMNMECFNNHSQEINHSPNQSHSKKKPMQNDFEQNIDLKDSKESLAFWTLVSMVTHVLPGYFIGVPHELNKEIKTPLRESYQDEIGLKRDLLILKFYIKEHEPAIFQLFEDVSLPLEFFYGNMLLCAGSDMVHNEVLYRIWDLMYLQKEKDQDPHFVLISLIILILRISKDHILKGFGHADCKHAAKDSREINDIIKIFETVSRFLPNPDDVIAELLVIQESLIEFIRKHYGEFNNLRNDLNTKFQNIRHQNKMFYDLIHKKNNFEDLKDKVGVLQIFKLMELLKGRHKLFRSGYRADVELSVPEEFDEYENPKEREEQELSAQLLWFRHFDSKNDPEIVIHLFLHKMTLFGSREEQPFKLEIIYQGETKAILPLEFNTTCYLNHYLQIQYNYKGKSEIVLQITLEREFLENMKSPKTLTSLRDVGTNKTSETMPSMGQMVPTKKKCVVKEAVINLDSFMVNYLQKSIARLDLTVNEAELNEDHNLTTSEVDFSLVLSTENHLRTQENIENSYRNNAKLLAQNLPKPLFKFETFDTIKEMNLEKFHEKFLKNLVNVLSLEHISTTSFAINPNEWRKNSKITYEQFRETLKAADFVEKGTLDYFALYNSIMNSNRDKTFYFTDFLILLILFSHTTPKQKSLLFYDTLMLFDNTKDLCNGISIQTVKSFTSYLYEVFMLSIPHHHVDNIIEFLSGGYVSGILSAKLDYKMQEKQDKIPQTLNFTNALINVSNYLHYYYNTKQLFLGDPNKMSLLKEVLENMNEDIRDISKALPQNEYFRLNLKYRQRGMKHKLQILFDRNWDIVRKLVLDPEIQELKIQSPEKYKLIENLLLQNENVIPLGDLESFLSHQDFLLLMEKLPMMNYLLGFSIFESNSVKIPKISCSVMLEKELISHVDNFIVSVPDREDFRQEYKEYKDLSYHWNQTRNDISDQLTKSIGAKASPLSFDHYPFYESFFNTLQLIQKKLMQNYLLKEIPGSALNILSAYPNSSSVGTSSIKKGKKAPEFSRIFDLDFRRVHFEMYSKEQAISGLFFCSLFDLAWLINQNRRGAHTGEMALVINYFNKNSERQGLIPRKPDVVIYDHFKRFEQKYQCLALFFYSYQSKEWLPCKIVQRFFSKRKKESKSAVPSYYGVRFQSEPDSTLYYIIMILKLNYLF